MSAPPGQPPVPDNAGQPPVAKPPTQLPKGRYPASRATIWLVTALVIVTCAALAFGVR